MMTFNTSDLSYEVPPDVDEETLISLVSQLTDLSCEAPPDMAKKALMSLLSQLTDLVMPDDFSLSRALSPFSRSEESSVSELQNLGYELVDFDVIEESRADEDRGKSTEHSLRNLEQRGFSTERFQEDRAKFLKTMLSPDNSKKVLAILWIILSFNDNTTRYIVGNFPEEIAVLLLTLLTTAQYINSFLDLIDGRYQGLIEFQKNLGALASENTLYIKASYNESIQMFKEKVRSEKDLVCSLIKLKEDDLYGSLCALVNTINGLDSFQKWISCNSNPLPSRFANITQSTKSSSPFLCQETIYFCCRPKERPSRPAGPEIISATEAREEYLATLVRSQSDRIVVSPKCADTSTQPKENNRDENMSKRIQVGFSFWSVANFFDNDIKKKSQRCENNFS